MKLGGLFSGVGGFELAWTRLGGEVAWMCEWDKNARKVLEARFPGVPIYPDVRDLDPAEVEPVDVLTGGSPCQGFSVAGKRTGLEHGESQLFADYVRIMEGLADRGLKWALWENVPGVLSIKNPDGERTFTHVIAALVGADEPVRLDPKRKWNTGVAAGSGRSVAWRVLDSRYFGVAQRRRRVFACVAFGDSCEDRAGRALLAVAEGVRGDSAEGVEEGEGATGGVAAGARVPSVAGTLGAKGSGGIDDLDRMTFLPDRPGVPSWWDGGDTAEALTRTSDDQRMPDKQRFQAVLDVAPAVTSKWAKGTGGPSGDEAQNLVTDSPAVLMTMREGAPVTAHETGQGWWNEADHAGTLRAEGENRPSRPSNVVVEPTGNGQTLFEPLSEGVAYDGYNQTLEVGVHRSLRIGRDSSDFVADQHSVAYGVRRLTPVECERLQAFPDGWTEPAGSDSARYKALGNAVTVNTVWWILRRMVAQG